MNINQKYLTYSKDEVQTLLDSVPGKLECEPAEDPLALLEDNPNT